MCWRIVPNDTFGVGYDTHGLTHCEYIHCVYSVINSTILPGRPGVIDCTTDIIEEYQRVTNSIGVIKRCKSEQLQFKPILIYIAEVQYGVVHIIQS